jgi:hypothetical protein
MFKVWQEFFKRRKGNIMSEVFRSLRGVQETFIQISAGEAKPLSVGRQE